MVLTVDVYVGDGVGEEVGDNVFIVCMLVLRMRAMMWMIVNEDVGGDVYDDDVLMMRLWRWLWT